MELAGQSAGYAARSDMTPDDRTAWDAVRTQITEIDTDIARLDSSIEQEEEGLRQTARHPEQRASIDGASSPPAPERGASPEMRMVRMRGPHHGADGQRSFIEVPVYQNPALGAFLRTGAGVGQGGWFNLEERAFQADSPTEGGFLSAGEQFVAQVIQAIDDQVFIRRLATVTQIGNGFTSLGVPTLDTDAEDTDWTIELGVGNEEDTMRVGKRSLTPHPLAKLVKMSNELLRASAISAEGLINSRIAYKHGITQEKGFLTGTGDGQPLGVYVASSDGISTSRDVSTGNTSASPTFDGLIEAKYTLKAAYWPRARWNFHRTAVKLIAKLKDGEGRYLWQPAMTAGQPDTILDMPLDVSEYTPSTFTTGLYVGMLADWSKYWIADSLGMQIQRLVELYAATNQIGFISRMQTDGMPVLEEAFVRVKLG